MEGDGERRLTITIRPKPSDGGLLKVSDAMQQVLDVLKVVEAASRSVSVDPQHGFDWRLESASTNSPFTVVVVAEARNPTIDVSQYVVRAKRETAIAFRNMRERRLAPPWLDQESRAALRNVYQRNLNGISETSIAGDNALDLIDVTQESAAVSAEMLTGLTPLSKMEIPARRLQGELTGLLVSVGRHRRTPSLTILTSQYGAVVCSVPAHLIEKLGGEKTLEDVWKGRRIAVIGTLVYSSGGKLASVMADDIQDRITRDVDIQALLDSDFTAGLEPTEYLDALHGGYLA